FSMADADGLRKAMGKKIPEIMAKYKEQFVKGAVKNGVKEEVAVQVFDLMAFFAGYGFNKSHSAAYGIVSYQTAYLKANYTTEYMCGLMSCAMGDTDKLAEYIEECRQLKIEVLPPDLNKSELDFVIVDGKIRFGLGAVKGAGEKAIQALLEERARLGGFRSLHQFCEHLQPPRVDRKVVEQLIKCGAFDSLGFRRAQLLEGLEDALRLGSLAVQDRKAGQMSIFGGLAAAEEPALPDLPEWAPETLLSFEKEVLGCYVTANPLLRYEDLLKTLSTTTVDHLKELEDGQEVTIGGIVSGMKTMITKNGKNAGQKYAMLKFADLTGSVEAVCFSTDFERNRAHLVNDAIVFATGRVGFRNDQPSLRISRVLPADKAREELTGSVRVTVEAAGLEQDLLVQLQEVLKSNPGPCPVLFEVETAQGMKVLVKTANEHFVSPSERFLADIEEVLGPGRVRLIGKPPSNERHGYRPARFTAG
ncbi:MAG TPA: OB-fold nucleic acid binding domain-containing protein, partial [Planctomycetota bacterium]|nr:OB-fold nucleic acid binding domain-containing protein [Planctomycetota bacterium]